MHAAISSDMHPDIHIQYDETPFEESCISLKWPVSGFGACTAGCSGSAESAPSDHLLGAIDLSYFRRFELLPYVHLSL